MDSNENLSVADAMDCLRNELRTDHDYRLGWFANLRMECIDRGVDADTATAIARNFMSRAFGGDIFPDGDAQ